MVSHRNFLYALIGASIFALVSFPQLYSYTNSYFASGGCGESSFWKTIVCPHPVTKVVHCVVFLVLAFLVLKLFNSRITDGVQHTDRELLKWALISTSVYYVISDDGIYTLTGGLANSLLGTVIEHNGCPNLIGITLHSIVFCLALWCLMLLGHN